MTTSDNPGLRERKKAATREALSAAALRLALEHGPQNVRVDDIAEAAGVSPRTYNNYFSSREAAIVAAVAAERALRVAAALRERPADEPLATAVIEAVVSQYDEPGLPAGELLRLVASTPGLRSEFVGTVAAIEQPIANAIAARTGDAGLAPRVLAAAVSAAARVAVESWIRPAGSAEDAENAKEPKDAKDAKGQQAGTSLLVVPQGSLPGLLRKALTSVAPALEAADRVSS